MKWPLAGVAGSLALGIAVGAWWAPPLLWLFGATVIAGAAALPAWRGAVGALAACVFFTGWSQLVARTAVLAPDDLRRFAGTTSQLATLRGTLVATPETRVHERGGRRQTNSLAVLECRTFQRPGEEGRLASGRVLLSAPFVADGTLCGGAEVEVDGVLQPPRGPQAPGLFDYGRYLHWRGIGYELRVGEPGDWRLAPGAAVPVAPWPDRFQRWAQAVLARGLDPEAEETQLLWAMTLGWKTALTDDVQEPFMRSGTMHIFAISGLHIALIAAIVGSGLRLLLVPRLGAGLATIAICWAYTVATGLQPSAIRSTIMTTVLVGGWMLARPSNVLNSLSAAACAVLVWDPRQLFQAGFQLSFAVVAALGLLASPLRTWMVRWTEPDPLLPLAEVSRLRQWLARRWGNLAAHLSVAITAWVGSLPLAANLFHLATPGSLLANLVVVPLSSAALASNVGSLVCGNWLPFVGELFNHSAWLWMRGMLEVSRWVAGVPGSCWNVALFPWSWTGAWYLGLVATGLGWWRWPRGRWGVAGVMVVGGLVGVAELQADRAAFRLVVIPLGSGHAVWVRHATGTTLVDAGDLPSAESVVAPFLKAQGVNRLGQLVLTHGDIRHVGGATNLLQRFRPREVLRSPIRFRSTAYRAVVDFADTAWGGGARAVWDGVEVWPWRVLHPGRSDVFSRADDGCVTLLWDAGGVGSRVLLLADLDRRGQALLLERHPELRAEVVVLAPPAGGAPPMAVLLEQVRPKFVVIADAEHPATAKARAEFRAGLGEGPWEVLYTSETGCLDLRWDADAWTIRDARGNLLDRGR